MIRQIGRFLLHPTLKKVIGLSLAAISFIFFVASPNSVQTPFVGQYVAQFQKAIGLGPVPQVVITGCGPAKSAPCLIQYILNVTVTSGYSCWRYRLPSTADSSFGFGLAWPYQQCGNFSGTIFTRNILMNYEYEDNGGGVTVLSFSQVGPDGKAVLVKQVTYAPGSAILLTSGSVQWWDPTCQPFPSNC